MPIRSIEQSTKEQIEATELEARLNDAIPKGVTDLGVVFTAISLLVAGGLASADNMSREQAEAIILEIAAITKLNYHMRIGVPILN